MDNSNVFVQNRFPSAIFIIRHGEKLEWKHGKKPSKKDKVWINTSVIVHQSVSPVKLSLWNYNSWSSHLQKSYIDNHELSAKGWERAFALVPYFQQREGIARCGEIAALFAQVSNHTFVQSSSRSYPKEIHHLSRFIDLSTASLSTNEIDFFNWMDDDWISLLDPIVILHVYRLIHCGARRLRLLTSSRDFPS